MKKTILVWLTALCLFFYQSVWAALTLPENKNRNENTVVADKHEIINDALKDFKSLSGKERRERIKEAKAALKDYKEKRNHSTASEGNNEIILLTILSILLPPLAVFLYEGEINTRFWLSLVLTLLFWLPGVIYALLTIYDVI